MNAQAQTYDLTNINWSISKLFMYESCAYRFKLRYIDKMPEPPLPPNNPMERGNRIHNNLEGFVKGECSLAGNESRALAEFHGPLLHLQRLYEDGKAYAEDNWFVNRDWNMCERKDVWLWSKLDFLVVDEQNAHAIVGDYKSGKSAYKAVDHIQQTQIYAAVTALKFPEIDTITSELWYVDEGWVRASEYSREEALTFVGRFDRRAQRIYDDRFFRANPSTNTCRYCPYNRKGTGACAVAAV